jgi:hypothetical protein
MIRPLRSLLGCLAFFCALPLLGCSSNGNKLYGSMSTMYSLSFNSVNIILQGTMVQIQYVSNGNGYPAQLIVDFTNIQNVAGSAIDLTQLDGGQPRGVLQRVSTVTTDFPIERGSVTFDQVPQVGQKLSGSFVTTLSNPSGFTLDGDFDDTVTAP